ncbi:fibronectin type III domain-containing protein (plasmid) [Embleya sp. NBC_00888]|uniref:spherulation-specific family 4 protein n=1 Tax=Embleya sp. NBC_00888 TaxID=2975960 RepID=UPI002F916B83|nr:fibronectin type III domain-containing protein [Embleya sp. NBC_00888]
MRTDSRARSWRARGAAAVAATAALLGGSLVATAPAAQADPGPGINQQIGIPAYFHPGVDPGGKQYWATLGSGAGTPGLTIVNIANGPSFDETTSNAVFASAIQKVRQAGGKVIAYVDTGYFGTNTIGPPKTTRLGESTIEAWRIQIQHDVDKWYRLYGPDIDGIFFDQGQNVCGPTTGSQAYVDEYRALTAYTKRNHPGALVVDNPGIDIPQCYEDAADIQVTFEGNYNDYQAFNPPQWELDSDPSKFWHLIYETSAAQMPLAVAQSKQKNAGTVYVTPDQLNANPWDLLPDASYWSAELAAAKVAPTAAPATPAQPTASVGSATSVQLSWPNAGPSTVAGYDVYRNNVKIGSVPHRTTGTAQFIAKDLNPSTAYTFTVRARNDAGVLSAASPARNVTTSAPGANPPGVPGSYTATVSGPTSVQLSWAASTPGSAAVEAYDIYQNNARMATVPAGRISAHLGDLTPGSTYSFDVVARDVTGRVSAHTAPVSLTPPPPVGGPIVNQSATLTATQAEYKATFQLPFTTHHVFIDADNDGSTGYLVPNGFPGIGADFMLENGNLYKAVQSGPVWDGTWQFVSITPSPLISTTNGQYVWRLPTSLFAGLNTGTQRVAFHGSLPESWVPNLTIVQQ